MICYDDLKKSSDGMPTWDSFLEPVLVVINQRNQWNSRKLKESVTNFLDLPKEIKSRHYANDTRLTDETIAENRVGFAISMLKNAGLLTSVKRGTVESNEKGQLFLKKNTGHITAHLVQGLPEYKAYKKMVTERDKALKRSGNEGESDNLSPEKTIDSIISKQEAEVANDLLIKILSLKPNFFEQLTVDLLSAMGYKGANGDAITTQLTADKGIDGIISEDPLGTKTVYIQAKRYDYQNSVSRPEIQSFYGALAEQGNDKGVFITTSSFSTGALNAAKKFGNIVTIDGIKLTNLMVEYKVGVNIKRNYALVAIDEDYFIEE